MGTEPPLADAFIAITELAAALGVAPLPEHVDERGVWVHDVDEHWRIVINPSHEPRQYHPSVLVPPFSCYVEFNGWAAGVMNPFGGVIAAGTLANEETFIEAVKQATMRAKERRGSK